MSSPSRGRAHLPKVSLNLQLATAFLTASLLGGLLVFSGVLLGGWITPPEGPPSPYSKDWFPCQEEEVLTFTPEAPPDQVACVHIDLLP